MLRIRSIIKTFWFPKHVFLQTMIQQSLNSDSAQIQPYRQRVKDLQR